MFGTPTATHKMSTAYTNPIQLINKTPNPRKNTFPPGKKIFTSDSIAMYPNTDTDKGMITMEILFEKKKLTR